MSARTAIVEAIAAYDSAAAQDSGLIDVVAKIVVEAEIRARAERAVLVST